MQAGMLAAPVMISDFLQERIDAGDFPSAVYLVAERGKVVLQEALGFAVVAPERIEARVDTIYDLASLTKVAVTGLLTSLAVEQGICAIDDKVSRYVDEFATADKSEIALRAILTHTSGLPPWRPLFLEANRNAAAVIADLPLDDNRPPTVVYSDLGFVILQKIIEKAFGRPIEEIFDAFVGRALGLTTTRFNPPAEWRLRIAASEKGNAYERQMCIENGYLDPRNPAARAPGSELFRNRLIWGEVHDGNAWFMGGVAGHAGLFSTAEEVFKIAQQFLPSYTTLLQPGTCELFRANFTAGMNEDRSFAFQLASTKDSTAGTKMPPESFGHNGFTGTSVWIDPVKERVFVLLTNRTHNHDLPFVNINAVRRGFHDLAIDFLDKNL